MRKELNTKEVGELAEKIEKQFGWKPDASLTYLAKDEKEGLKIFLYSGLKIPDLPVEWIGMHFGTIIGDDFQPSIDGAMLMRTAVKNILDVTRKELEDVMAGKPIGNKGGFSGSVILKSNDLVCAGMAQEGAISSLTPPSRRTQSRLE